MLLVTYYAFNYAGIIGRGLSPIYRASVINVVITISSAIIARYVVNVHN